MDRPWFKLYAADTLVDAKLDAIPPEAHGLILKMWCLCHLEGSCPSDPIELARKCRLPLPYVLLYESLSKSLFESLGTSLFSPRMEKEKRRSAINRDNAKKGVTGFAKRIAKGIAEPRSDYDYDNDSGVDLDLKVLELAKIYPKVNDPMNLPRIAAEEMCAAIVRDGFDLVMSGTKGMAERVAVWPKTEWKFIPATDRYYRESQYKQDPQVWERRNGNGKQSAIAAERNVDAALDARRAARRAVGLDH